MDEGDIFFSQDGTKFYYCEPTFGNAIFQWDLSTAWDISTATFNQEVTPQSQPADLYSFAFSPDGKTLITLHSTNDMNEYSLSTAWDISTISNSPVNTYDVVDTSPFSIRIGSDSTLLFVLGTSTNLVYQHLATNNNTPTNAFQSLRFINGKFFAVSANGDNRIIYSTNGIEWTASTGVPAQTTQDIAGDENGNKRISVIKVHKR